MNPSTKGSRANPTCLLATLPTSALLLTTIAMSACQPGGPKQKEVFELRSMCGALADRSAKEANEQSPGIVYTYRGHYDPQTNRCVEKVHDFFPSTPGVQQDFLLDAQSHALLAKCMLYIDPPGWGCEINHKDASHEQTEEFIDTMMGSDK
jgi:hypothetical protein